MSEVVSYDFKIPRDLLFMELALKESPEGSVSFSWEPLQRICSESGVDDQDLLYASKALIPMLVAGWLASLHPFEFDADSMSGWSKLITKWLMSTCHNIEGQVPHVQVHRSGDALVFQ